MFPLQPNPLGAALRADSCQQRHWHGFYKAHWDASSQDTLPIKSGQNKPFCSHFIPRSPASSLPSVRGRVEGGGMAAERHTRSVRTGTQFASVLPGGIPKTLGTALAGLVPPVSSQDFLGGTNTLRTPFIPISPWQLSRKAAVEQEGKQVREKKM